jgi:hypothetical protein
MRDRKVHARAEHVAKCVILLDDLDRRSVGNLGILNYLNPEESV